MVDYDAMMSSTGGTGFGDRALGSGLLAGVGITAIELFVRNKEQLKKELKANRSKIRAQTPKGLKAGASSRILDRIDTNAAKLRGTTKTYTLTGPVGPGQFSSSMTRRTRVNEVGLKKATDKIREGSALMGRSINALKSSSSGIRNSFANSKRTLKTLGWISTITDAFFIAESMFNPGPSMSAKAQASDLQAFNSLQGSGAMTQRQRSLQAIHDSQLSINPILGNESQFLHR